MSTGLKRTVRNRLVDDSALRALLSVTTTGSATVFPTFMERSGIYAQIVYSQTEGSTLAGMSATDGFFSFNIEVQATGGNNPHVTYERIQERIEQLIDDQNLTGSDISGTSVYACLFLRAGGLPAIYIPERKVYSKIINFSYRTLNR